MHVAVLGAGVVGITTAHYLLQAGHDVTIIDRAPGAATQCSHANGAQLSYSFVDAMANPSFLARIPGLLLGRERGIRIRPPLDARTVRWGASFVMQCSATRATDNTLANLDLARRSRQLLDELMNYLDDDFSHRNAGKLVLLSSKRDVENARRTSGIKASFDCAASIITLDEAIDIEPSIAELRGNYAGAVWSPGDDVGDARKFTEALTRHIAKKPGCRLLFDTRIDSIAVDDDELTAIITNAGPIEIDAAVVCLGCRSAELLAPIGVSIPVVPVRGYSVTLPPGPHSTSVSLTDFASRFVISRIGDRVRIAGFADFVGFDTSRDAQRIATLLDVARQVAPATADFNARNNRSWGGFRPMTPNGRPLIGATNVAGVYLNTGHGSLGWTLACASGDEIARQLSTGTPAARAA